MTLEQLRAFVAIVEHGSIRAGARALGIAQSGLTQQLHRLEHSLSATLFTRASTGVVLTAQGHTLLTRARLILGECHRTEQEFNYLQGRLSGSINVGSSAEASARLLPEALRQLRWAHPGIAVNLASGPSSLLLSGIREGKLDFAMTLVSHGSDLTDLHSVKLADSQARILCRRGHPLQHARSIHALREAEWINTRPLGRAGTPSNRLGDWFSENGLAAPNVALTVESLLDTLRLLSETDYLFLGPNCVLDHGDGQHLSALSIDEPLPAAEICLVQRQAVPLAPAARVFVSMLLTYNRAGRPSALDTERAAP